MKRYLLWLVTALPVNTLCAQKITGYVFGKNNEALVAATVINLNSHQVTITDGKGYFELNIISANDTLIAQYVGYDRAQIIASSLTKKDTILINQSSHDLQDVVISSIDQYELVKRIIIRTKHALPHYCSYNYYFKGFIKIGGKIKYYSDALVQTDLNNGQSTSYLLASRALKKIDSTDEKIIGKIHVVENINNRFSRSVMFKNTIFEEDEKGRLKKDFRISLHNSSDSMIVITFQPIGKIEQQEDSIIWFVSASDSTIRTIHKKLPASQKGKLRATSLVAKQFKTNDEEILNYEKNGDFLLLKSSYSTLDARLQGRMLLRFDAFDYQADAAFTVIRSTVANQDIPKPEDKKELHWNDSLQSFGKNYTTAFWINIQGIEVTQDEKDFFN